MGTRGPVPKDPSRRQRRNKPQTAAVVPIEPKRLEKMPKLPSGMLTTTTDAWKELWQSPLVMQLVLPTDLPALRRLFSLYDERERALRGYREERLVPGSQGQMVINPLAKVMATCDAEIRALEDRFGLTPVARMRLGVAFGEAQKSLEEMNRDLNRDEVQEDPEDPRAIEA